MMMLDGANHFKFKDLRGDLDSDFAKGNNTYPINHNVVIRLLNSQILPSGHRAQHLHQNDSAMMFARKDGGKPDNRICF